MVRKKTVHHIKPTWYHMLLLVRKGSKGKRLWISGSHLRLEHTNTKIGGKGPRPGNRAGHDPDWSIACARVLASRRPSPPPFRPRAGLASLRQGIFEHRPWAVSESICYSHLAMWPRLIESPDLSLLDRRCCTPLSRLKITAMAARRPGPC